MFNPLRLALALAAPLLLCSCLLTPGEFVSTLDIGRDRSFTFTYVGEVIVSDPGSGFGQSMAEAMGQAPGEEGSEEAEGAEAPQRPTEIGEAQREAVLEALSKEEGYRSVEYLGENRFRVDYAITGRLDRSFVYPINIDAMSIIPWIVIEVRRDGSARLTGLAFGSGDGANPVPSDPAALNRRRNGTFTLTTDADLVMHNNEDGASGDARKTVSWRITPTTRDGPTAVVRFPG